MNLLKSFVAIFSRKQTVDVENHSESTVLLPSPGINTVSPAVHVSLDHPPPYSLGELQRIFPLLVFHLIEHAYRSGFEFTYGETWRPPEMAQIYAKQGKGIRNSLHGDRLAVDFNLFKNGVYLNKTEDHRPLGIYWESLATPGIPCTWGGSWGGDGNHYSIAYQGRK